MKRYRTTALAAGLFALALPLLAAQPPAPADPAPQARIAKLLADLDSPKFPLRERATRELLALEQAAFEPLKKAMAAPPSAEFEHRARAILQTLVIYEPGGEVVNGLKLRLTADRTMVKIGERVMLTTMLANMTDRPMNIQYGYSTCGNYFACGSTLRQPLRLFGAEWEASPQWKVGFCGTGAGPLFVTVAPRSMFVYQTPAAALIQKDGKTVLALGQSGYMALDTWGGTHRLRMELTLTPEHARDRGFRNGSGIRPANEQAPFWSGIVRSNEIMLTVVP
jgi:hypothetical protein